MKGQELIDLIQNQKCQDHDVIIKTNNISIGTVSHSIIKFAVRGFDWENGKLVLHATDGLWKLGEDQANLDDVIKDYNEKIAKILEAKRKLNEEVYQELVSAYGKDFAMKFRKETSIFPKVLR